MNKTRKLFSVFQVMFYLFVLVAILTREGVEIDGRYHYLVEGNIVVFILVALVLAIFGNVMCWFKTPTTHTTNGSLMPPLAISPLVTPPLVNFPPTQFNYGPNNPMSNVQVVPLHNPNNTDDNRKIY